MYYPRPLRLDGDNILKLLSFCVVFSIYCIRGLRMVMWSMEYACQTQAYALQLQRTHARACVTRGAAYLLPMIVPLCHGGQAFTCPPIALI